MKTFFYSLSLIGIISLFALVFKPVPIPESEEHLNSYKGKVIEIYEGGTADVVMVFENHETKYYINRGLQFGLDLDVLQKDILNTEIEVLYPDYWTPLDPTQSVIHVTVLKKESEVLYTEIDC